MIEPHVSYFLVYFPSLPNWKFSIVNDFLFHALDRNCRIQLILLTIVKKHKLFIAQLVRRRLTTLINKPIHNGEIDFYFSSIF